MKLNRVDHIDLVVRDIGRSMEFYKKLGMVVEGTLDKGHTVFLSNQDRQRPLVIELHQAEAGQQPGLGHIAFQVDDVEAVHRELASAGVPFANPPAHNTGSGRTIALASDPDGIPVQFARKTSQGEYLDFK